MSIKDKDGKALTSKEIFYKIINRIRTIKLEFITGFLWWGVGKIPCHPLRRFFYRLTGMKIGKGSTLHMGARIYDPRHIEIGEDSLIGENATLDGRKQLPNSNGGLKIGNHVDIASQVMIWTSQHNIHSENMQTIEEKVEIEDYVFIGPRAIILPGVKIAKGAVIGAGAVVTKNVDTMSIVVGVPAKEIAKRKTAKLNYKLGRARWFQ
ncbi:MAG: acyltransferase [Candidatus Woesebacteria bacterium]|jgi:maltose O-acetyltransferase